MLEIRFIREILAYALGAACAYCLAAFFYIKTMSFSNTWVLYVGNFLFAIVIGIFVAWFYRRHIGNVSIIRLVVIGGKTTFAGIVMVCLICLLLLFILVPSIFRPEQVSHLALNHAPPQFAGKNQGFGKILFINAVLGNAAASFFISLLIPFSIMKNQYTGEGK